jgi:cytochrome P450
MTLETDVQALFTPAAIQNPHPVYANLRAHGDVVVVPEWNSAFAFSLEATNALFKHPASSADRLSGMSPDWFGYPLLKPMMLFHDHAAHARLRGLVSQAFTPKAVAETRGFIAGLADELLEGYARSSGDFVSAVAVPFPMLVIAQLMGIEDTERERFRAWGDTLIALLDGSTYDETRAPKMQRDVEDMRAYFRQAADRLRHHDQPGVLAAMARAEAGGERLSSDELLANAVLLLGAGFETTTNLLAGAMLAFSQFPEEWHKLLGDRGLIPNAAEECLRFVSPVQATGRQLREAVNWHGQVLNAGMSVSLMLGAANRDPLKFTNPEALEVTRPNADKHVAFASGAHYCLGAPLARLEAQVFLERLALKFPAFTVPEQPLEYRHNFSVRGLNRLEVRLNG